ncbi:MAG: hypothetical protein H0T84_10340 [Tatlockia sp.]|nr:hypothetical protein [Tatlockia sp.]
MKKINKAISSEDEILEASNEINDNPDEFFEDFELEILEAEDEILEAEDEPNETTDIFDISRSDQFEKLDTYYLNTIREDKRDHSFLGCFKFKVDKAGTLLGFLNDLRHLENPLQVKDYLINFYRTKNSSADSPFNILNKGQNITSRFFGLKTTTIELIDDLARSFNIDLKAIENEIPYEQALNLDC